jgi:hypothetical protein
MNDNRIGDFVIFIRTKQFWQSHFRNLNPLSPIYVSNTDVRLRLNNPIEDIQYLVSIGEIEVIKTMTKKGEMLYYRTLKKGGINPSILKPNKQKLDELTQYMQNTLKFVTLDENAPRTDYFNVFLNYKNENIELFFTIDKFSGRVHTPISSFHREYRTNILINGNRTKSLDVVTMQPLLLGKILDSMIGENDYSNWINSGNDIYLIIKEKANLKTRDEAKKRFFEILFSKPNKQLSEMFGNANWIEWINEIKSIQIKENPHSIEKHHSNLAWLLQKTEVQLMRFVWQSLKDNNIIFLSVHDEIIIQECDYLKAKELFNEVLMNNFEYFKLSSK